MTAPSLKILVVQGTIRDRRSSIHPARYVIDQFRENGYDVKLFDMKDYEIPLFTEVGQTDFSCTGLYGI